MVIAYREQHPDDLEGIKACFGAEDTEFQPRRWHKVRLRVTQARIEVWLDERKVIDLETGGHRLVCADASAPLKPLGVRTWTSRSALRNIMLRRLPMEGPEPGQP